MTITEFVASHAAAKVKADVVERWETRVVASGWHIRGRNGAEAYISQYMKGAKADKAIGFARIAEIKGFPEMSTRFWEEAFFLQTGTRASLANGAPPVVQTIAAHVVAESFGQSPQLLVLVDLAEAMRMVDDDSYGLQEKVDGRRALIRVREGRVSRGNKKGLVAPVPLSIADALSSCPEAEFDGEEVNGVYHAFDLLSLDGDDLRGQPFERRHGILTALIAKLPKSASLKLVPLITGRQAKREKVEQLRAAGAEGFVLKRLYADYEAGDSHRSQWKYQFRALSSFIVGPRNGVKESVQILVNNQDGSLRDMGNLTVRTGIPPQGSIVEVEYLYCHAGPSGKLHQPVFKHIRDDASAADCRIEKIKVKRAADTADEEETG